MWYRPPATIILNLTPLPRNLLPTIIGDSVVLQSVTDSNRRQLSLTLVPRLFACGELIKGYSEKWLDVARWENGTEVERLTARWEKCRDIMVMLSATAFTAFFRHRGLSSVTARLLLSVSSLSLFCFFCNYSYLSIHILSLDLFTSGLIPLCINLVV
ncbi:hypothetical protein L873DRAFT_197080 [Choiromyces venosus 120613-1]|uniref:Uncharacterized protein n=1 Tax=Choiromyces venosus 120613-1 TaxID=1336337 RepID=A0A3N4J568_9PEZI|nr:hypothetical protein L873DRAFT_197080 [Choiromyces venosus 120613-1]